MGRTTRLVPSFGQRILAAIVAIGLASTTVVVMYASGVFIVPCLRVNDRICNGHGTCLRNGRCSCDAFFSGSDCSETLSYGYSSVTGKTCSGNGQTGAALMTKDYISAVCRDKGWASSACFVDTQERIKRIDDNTASEEDLFAAPLCMCYPPFTGRDCSQTTMPRSVSFEVCSGNGNLTVDLTNNRTTDGLGAQCIGAPIVNLLSPTLLTTYSREGLITLRQNFASSLGRELCGTLYTHSNNTDLKLVYEPLVTYACFCDERHFGPGCEFGVCPEDDDGRVCSGHGHPNLGAGAEKNATTKSLKGQTVCSQGTVNCYPQSDRCVTDLKLCKYPLECSAEKPVRCRDGLCVIDPGRATTTGYTFGLVDNLTQVLVDRICESYVYKNNESFLTQGDYTELLHDCAGDEATILDNYMVPAGEVFIDTSLIAFWIEGVSDQGSLTLYYRGQTRVLQGDGPQLALFNETYEQEERRLSDQLDTNITVTITSATTVDVYPAPFIYDIEVPVPEAWQTFRVISTVNPEVYSVLETSISRVEFNSQGDWFLANLTNDRILVPGGNVISQADCMDDFRSCIWNYETRLSYDGTRKLCGTKTSSTNLACTINTLPATYRRLFTVISATTTENRDWASLAPWRIGTRTLSDIDFTNDGDWLTLVPSDDYLGVRAISHVELGDLIRPGACPPSLVNASTLDETWVTEVGRRTVSTLAVGSHVVAKYHAYGTQRIVRGVVTGPLQITTRGYDNPLVVEEWHEITSVEFTRGLPHESFRVFPAMCSTGQPATLASVDFVNVSVTCDCVITSVIREAECTCHDDHVPTYSCTCDGTSCNCGSLGMWHLDQQLLDYTKDLEAVCFFSGGTDGELSVTTYTAEDETIEFERVGGAAYLTELRVYPCQPYLVLQGRASIFSDVMETFSYDTSCTGLNQTVKPVFPGGFHDIFDIWSVTNVTNGTTVTAVFAPNGVPVTVTNVTVTSSESDKSNILSNDLTYWRSELADIVPVVTVTFLETYITGVFIVLETTGIYVDENFTMPVAVYVQGTTNGIHWTTLKRVMSAVYHGKEDHYVSIDAKLVGLRLKSDYVLGVRELVPLTNQRCDVAGVVLDTDAGFQSLTDTVLKQVLERSENTSLPCLCTEDCTIGGRSPRDTDECVDAKYSVEVLGIAEYEWAFAGTYTADTVYHIMANYTPAYNETFPYEVVYTDSRYLKTWGVVGDINDSLVNVVQATGEGYAIVLDDTQEWNLTSVDPYPRYDIYTEVYIVDRGLACRTGTHCSKCGISNRLNALDPGRTCTLTDYEQRLRDDYLNRSDHTIQNSGTLDDYLGTGKVRVRVRVIFTRNTTVIAKKNCGTCDGLFICQTGECVMTSEECPVPRYDNPGDGCTRISTKERKFKCACDVGWGGLKCGDDYAIPGDPYTGKIDPHLWQSCGADPPIKYLPGRSLIAPLRGYYTNSEILVMNRDGIPRTSDTDVRWYRVSAEFASFGIPFLRGYREGNRIVRTNCPFQKRGPFGQKLSLEKCVKTRDYESNQVTEWTSFATNLTGVFEQYVWLEETQYDDFPYRCPHGACVASEKDCYNDALVNPPCGVGGKCRVDGTCDCPSGTKTFVYTKEWTNKAMVPYTAENPTIWGKYYEPFWHHCEARDCSEGRCPIPYGCFPGTLAKNFRDHQVACKEPYVGKCGVDYKSCERGEALVDASPCSAKGVPYQVDYRPEEWRCQCGELKTRLTTLLDGVARETTELKPNGWGGPVCEVYFCQENPLKLHWVQLEETTRLPFVDDEGRTLPGKWLGGSCGAVNGPNPDDIVQWQACCPGISRLERCNRVLCRIGNAPTCVMPQECTGAERTPMIYPCHGKGAARADGTCECQRDDSSGVGYGAGVTGEGCYRRINCPKASNGSPCNNKQNDWRNWAVIPYIPFLESQIYSLFLRQGIQPTNETLVRSLVDGPQQMVDLVKNAHAQIARKVISQINSLYGEICVYPNDDPSSPQGMVQYVDFTDIIGYRKAYKAPFDVTPTTVLPAFLIDKRYQQYQPEHLVPPREGIEYYAFTSSLTLTFTSEVKITHIKLYASYDVEVILSFTGDAGQVCNGLINPIPVAPLEYRWLGANNIHTCQQEWESYDFIREFGYGTYCKGNVNRPSCYDWKDTICRTIPLAKIQALDEIKVYPGCLDRCCVPKGGDYAKTTTLTITTNTPFKLQEVVVMGYGDVVLSAPTVLLNEIRWRQGNIDATTPHNGGQCLDLAYLRKEEILGNNGEYFVYGTFVQGMNTPSVVETLTYDQAYENCRQSGSWLAMSRGADNPNNYALMYGDACGAADCLIGARNRDEMLVPTLPDFFKPSCSAWGCYTCESGAGSCDRMEGGRIDYYSTSDNGDMWKTNWAGVSLTWGQLMDKWYTAGEGQKLMIGSWTTGTNNPALDYIWRRYGPHIRYTQLKYWNTIYPSSYWPAEVATLDMTAANPATTYSNVQSRVINDIVQPPFVQPEKGVVTQHWVSDKICKVILYGERHCGYDYDWLDAGVQNFNTFPMNARYKGPMRVIYVTPADDYANLYKNVIGTIWNECADGTTSCYGYLTPILNPYYEDGGNQNQGVNIQSIAVQGDCSVRTMRRLAKDGSRLRRWYIPYPNQYYRVHKVNEGSQYTSASLPTVLGCTNQFMNSNFMKFPIGGNGQISPADGDYRYYVNVLWEDRFYDSNDYEGIVDEVVIYPHFDNYQVELNVRAEPTSVNNNNGDDFTLGLRDHPYMCARMDVRILKGFTGTSNTVNFQPDVDGMENEIANAKWVTTIDPSAFMIPSEPVLFDAGLTGLLTLTHVREMLAQGPNKNYSTVFKPCSELGRTVIDCPTCVVEQPVGKYEWDPRKYDSLNPTSWTVKVDALRQTSFSLGGEQVRPVVHTTWRNSTDSLINNWMNLPWMQYRHTRAYVRQIALLRLPDYRVKFALDNCVMVHPSNRGGLEYTLNTTVCYKTTHRALCQRDYLPYAIQSGMQCDYCGPAGRPDGNPNAPKTAFDLYPLAIEANFPQEHAIKDSYLAGTLDDYVVVNAVNYDLVWEFLNTLNTTLVWPFIRPWLIQDYSDCPGHLSTQVSVGNPNNCVRANWRAIWPVDCGLQCSKLTGVCRRRLAVESKYCDPDAPQFALTELPATEYPLDMLPITSSTPYKEPRCGVQIHPGTYHVYDQWGPPSLSTKAFVVLENNEQGVLLKMTRNTASWQNTGKSSHGVHFTNQTRIYGTFTCSRACTVEVWVSSLDPTFSTRPHDRTSLGNFTTSPFTVDVVTQTYFKILGWDVYGLLRDDTIRIGVALASTPTTIAACQRDHNWVMYQPPSSIEKAEPNLQCVWERTEELEPGQCSCDDPSFGGESCEAPATVNILRGGKYVCGGYGVPGGKTLDYFGDVVPVNPDGSWQSKSNPALWGCTTINPGLIFRTRLYPSTRFDYMVVYITERQVGERDYVEVPILEDFELLTLDNTRATCASESTSMASWQSADELTSFLVTATGLVTFVNMEWQAPDEDHLYLKWGERESTLVDCSVDCGTTITVNPCDYGVNDDQCRAIMWNNLVFNTTNNGLTDGTTSSTYVVVGTETIPLVTTEVVTVKVYAAGSVTVRTQPGTVSCPLASGIYTCSADSITSIEVTAATVTVREVLVYLADDGGRFEHFLS